VKKLPVYLILFLCTIPLWAQDQFEYFETGIVVYPEFGMEEDAEEPEPEPEPIKEKFRLKNRTVELSIAGFNFNFANDFITAADVFRSPYYILENIRDIIDDPILLYNDPIKINLNDFFDGFKFQFGTEIKPLSINFNRSDRWGFGLDIGHIKAEGNQALAENILTLNSTDQERSGVGGAIFVDVGIPVFFHIKKLKVKIRPSVYVPLVYTEPEISYVIREGTEFKYTYNMHVYSLVDFGGLQDGDTDPMVQGLQDNYWSILRENMGYDFCLGLEYPLNRQLDIGFNAVNIPVPYAAATLNHYMQVQGSMSFELHEIDVSTIKDDEGFWEKIYKFEFGDFTTGYDEEGKKIYRPFKLLFYANYRPFGTRTLTLIPSLGFSINYFYSQPAAVEGGLGIRFDLANIIITTFGVNYNDRRWKNSIDFALNLRAFEIDLGLSFEGINFIQSWQGAGLCVNFGLKLGW
jgi:hypothetical protein